VLPPCSSSWTSCCSSCSACQRRTLRLSSSLQQAQHLRRRSLQLSRRQPKHRHCWLAAQQQQSMTPPLVRAAALSAAVAMAVTVVPTRLAGPCQLLVVMAGCGSSGWRRFRPTCQPCAAAWGAWVPG
jgi:Flp pilus assembly protein TadB